ncbi:MAG: hypothetical protein JWO09_460 [Bacteroidetes bacterium]|nr:hypothetical protein [Bacteroidota bacterium]
MKKNDWILLSSVFAYSFLFYRQGTGINFLIFSALLVFLLLLKDRTLQRNKPWLIAAAGALASSFCVFYIGNGLSLTANIISLMLLSAFSVGPGTSVITSLFFSAYSTCASFVFMILDAVERAGKRVAAASGNSSFLRFMIYIVPFTVVLVFFFLYKGSNPLFDEFTKNINLDFISAGWVFFTLGGTFLMYGFMYHKTIPAMAAKDRSIPNDLSPGMLRTDSWFARNLGIENEVRSGVILLILLNGLLLLVNMLDLNYLWGDGTLPKGMSYSVFVHQGTGLLILSIIIAILIIMFYFRGRVNFYEKNKTIKMLAYAWIIQNAFMIISTAFRNSLYVNEYSLTYKRIGVYVWLLLALIGLVTTFVKIMRSKTNWFLFRSNSWLFYGLLVISCFVNWDLLVTNFNINRSLSRDKALDKFYLLSLSDVNLPQLLSLDDSIKHETMNDTDYNYRNISGGTLYDERDFQAELSSKLSGFMDRMHNKDWRSMNISDSETYRKLLEMNEQHKVKSLKFLGTDFSGLSLRDLSNLDSLELNGAAFADCYELHYFPKLRSLVLINGSARDITRLPAMEELRSLDISNNDLVNIFSLRKLPNLEELNMEGNNRIRSFAVISDLKKLRHLKIGLITQKGLNLLRDTYPQVKIEGNVLN